MKPTILFSTALLLGVTSFAIPARAIAPAAPATQPAGGSPEVAALIAQLGEDDFHVRLGAARRLKEIGKPAIAALHEARNSADPEVHARAVEILQELEQPADADGPVPQPSGFGNQSTRIFTVNGVRTVEVQEPGRTIHIEQNAAGITMKVAGQLDGRHVTREYKARNSEQLRKENAQAFALFQQYGGAGNFGQILIQGNAVRIQGNMNFRVNGAGGIAIAPGINPQNIVPIVPPNPNGDNIERLQEKLLDQMRANKLPEVQQDEVKGLLQHLRDNAGQDVHARMREYDRKCDDLRKRLAELKLADPGDILPPPAAQRLGIAAIQDPVQGQGLLIVNILPGERAEKMGLKEQDVILKVNGQDVRTTGDLRKLATEHAKGLIVEGQRDGKALKLEEK